jgi:hypothetical protein
MKVFLDANIFIDVYDEKRKNNKFSSLTKNMKILSSEEFCKEYI